MPDKNDGPQPASDRNLGPGGLPEPGLPIAKVDMIYRVFCESADMPPLEKLLARLTSGNPYNPPKSFIFPPGRGMRRLQEALGASKDFFVMGYLKAEAPDLFADLATALKKGEGSGFEDADRRIVEDAKLVVVLRAQMDNPDNNEYVETLVHLADAFRDLLHGVVWDVQMGRVWGFSEWREKVMEEPISVLSHLSIAVTPGTAGLAGGSAVRTRGLAKFGSLDLEVCLVPADAIEDVGAMLRDFAEHVTQGEVLADGDVIDYTHGRVRLVPGGREGILRIVDDESDEENGEKGAPKLVEGLRAARRDVEGRRAGGGHGAQ